MKQQVAQQRRATDAARARTLWVVLAVVVAVTGVLAALGATLASTRPTTLAGCAPPPKPLGTTARLDAPDPRAVAGQQVRATITTNCGDIRVELNAAAAPRAVASFVQLARADYWLDSPCHRLLDSSSATVLQCGDPTGSGQGTPGYGFAVENAPKNRVYPRGTLAMARTGDPRSGNGGQFFIVGKDSTFPDPAGYTIFGEVTSGLDIVDSIVAAGVAPSGQTPDDGAPAAPISILRVAVTEKKAEP